MLHQKYHYSEDIFFMFHVSVYFNFFFHPWPQNNNVGIGWLDYLPALNHFIWNGFIYICNWNSRDIIKITWLLLGKYELDHF